MKTTDGSIFVKRPALIRLGKGGQGTGAQANDGDVSEPRVIGCERGEEIADGAVPEVIGQWFRLAGRIEALPTVFGISMDQ